MTKHFTDSFARQAHAASISRRIRIRSRLPTSPMYCDECKAWHLTIVDGRINKTDLMVLDKIARGFRSHEIAADIGESYQQVQNRARALMEHFEAQSRTNLIAIAIYYGLVDLSDIVVGKEMKEQYG